MNELLPIVSGLMVGLALGLLAPRLRFLTGAIAAVVLGTLATVVSGEFRLSWAYLLIDIPLVAVASVAGLLAGRLVRRQFSGAPPVDGWGGEVLMSDGSTSAAGPEKGEGRADEGASSPAHEKGEQDDKELAPAEDHPEKAQNTTEVPIGIPMTEEQWRQAKKRAERPDTGDDSGEGAPGAS
jgi:hypothetical protein